MRPRISFWALVDDGLALVLRKRALMAARSYSEIQAEGRTEQG